MTWEKNSLAQNRCGIQPPLATSTNHCAPVSSQRPPPALAPRPSQREAVNARVHPLPSSAQGESELSPSPQGPTPSGTTPLCPQILPLSLSLTRLWPHGSCSPNTPETFPPQGLCTPPCPSPKISARFPPSLEFLEMACVPLPKLTATLRVGLCCVTLAS